MTIKIEFEGLEDLSVAEMKVCRKNFQDWRDRYAAEGRHGLAAVFSGALEAVCEEADRREAAWADMQADFMDDDEDFEWNCDAENDL